MAFYSPCSAQRLADPEFNALRIRFGANAGPQLNDEFSSNGIPTTATMPGWRFLSIASRLVINSQIHLSVMWESIPVKNKIFKTKHIFMVFDLKMPEIAVVKNNGAAHGSKIQHPSIWATLKEEWTVCPISNRKTDDR